MKRRPAVFLDRDGTILRERGYLSDPQRLRFYPSAIPALRRLQKAGFALVIVTNQSGVGRGYFTEARLGQIHAAFRKALRAKGVRLAGIYYCPHAPGAGCSCRKPRPGMPRRAARELKLDLRRSFVVGDQDRDLLLAKGVGASPILVLTGGGRSHRSTARRIKAFVARDLGSAALSILNSLLPDRRER